MTAEELNMDKEIMWQMFTTNLNMTGKCTQRSCISKLRENYSCAILTRYCSVNFFVFPKL